MLSDVRTAVSILPSVSSTPVVAMKSSTVPMQVGQSHQAIGRSP